MMTRTFFYYFLVAVFFCNLACVLSPKPTVVEKVPPPEGFIAVSKSYSAAWEKAIILLAKEGHLINYSSQADGIIISDKKPVRLSLNHADCGDLMGIPYLKDRRTKTELHWIILLRLYNNKAFVQPNAFISGRIGGEDVLNCKSKGNLEKEFIARIQNQLNPDLF